MADMGPDEHEQLRVAAELHRPLARAASLGRKHGMSLALFGALTLALSALGPDYVGLSIGAVVLATGLVEWRVAPRLVHADASAPRILARSECTLLAAIVVYCLLQLTTARSSGEELARQVGGTGDLGIDVAEMAESFTLLVYVTVMAVALAYQGGMALYYLRRRAMIATYQEQTPEWARKIVEALDK